MTKVAAISTKDEVRYERKGHSYDPYLSAFIEGANGIASDWNTEENTDNTLVIRGVGGTSQKAIKHCWTTGREFYHIDTGYFGNYKHKTYHRITHNNLQTDKIIKRPFDRLRKIGYQYVPQRLGSTILICPPSEKVMSLFGQPSPTIWVHNTIEEIRKYTDRRIVIRYKPTRSERVSTMPIKAAIENNVHCLITYNSIAATEALMYGVPAITLGPNSASLLCSKSIADIENLNYPCDDEMQEYMAHLSYSQFTELEMMNGVAWNILQGEA